MSITIKDAINSFKAEKQKIVDGFDPGIKTPYTNINGSLLNGLPKNTITTIAGFSGHGKTTLFNDIMTNMTRLNPNIDPIVFSLEAPPTDLVAKYYSSVTGYSMKDILLDNKIVIKDELLERLFNVNIEFYTEAGTPSAFYDKVDFIMKSRISNGNDREVVIGLDHMLLFDGVSDGEKINAASLILNKLKLKYRNLSFIMLSQLNDAMQDNDRIMRAKKMLPTYSDLYFGRQLYQVSDTVMVINNPSEYLEGGRNPSDKGYYQYGANVWAVEINKVKENLIFIHIIKGRNSGTSTLKFLNRLRENTLIPLDDKYNIISKI